MLAQGEFPCTRPDLTTLFVKQEDVRPNLWLLVVLVAMVLLVRIAPVHADTVPLSSLIANPSAEITGPGGLVYSQFTYSSPTPLPSLPLNDISVSTDSVSETQSRIRFGTFTAPAGTAGFATITYQVTSTIVPVTDFHLVTPPGVTGPGVSGRAFVDAGYLITADITGVGSTFISKVQSFPGDDHALLSPTFPSGLATLPVRTSLQIFGGESSGPFGSPNAFLTLPHFDEIYTVTVVPEPSAWLLLTSGLIALMVRLALHQVPEGAIMALLGPVLTACGAGLLVRAKPPA